MILSRIDDKLIFKYLLFMWVLSIPFKNAIFQASVLLLVFFLIYHVLKTKRFDILIENLKETIPLLVGFSLIIFSMILSNLLNLEYIDKKSWHLIYMFILRYGVIFIVLSYFYSLNYFNKKEIILVVFSSLCLLGFTGVYEVFQNPNVLLLGSEGIKGSLDWRNAFGLHMGMGFVLSLLLIKNKRILGFLFISFFTFLMIFSFCRSSWIASIATCFVLFLLNYKNFKFKHIGYLFIFLGFLSLLYFNFDSFQARFALLLEGNSSFRTTIWQHTIVLIQKSLFFGYGMDSWKNIADEYLLQFPDSHNMVLEILIKTGLFGLIVCFSTIIVVLIKIFKTKNYILLPVATYFLVITQFDYGAFGSKELLSFLTIFVFFIYSDSYKLSNA